MTKKIQNEEKKLTKDINLNDSDILNDTLLSFKMLVDNYAISLNEASNNAIYQLYKNIFDKFSATQQELYQLAFQKGWYKLEEADKSKINETVKQFEQKTKELNVN